MLGIVIIEDDALMRALLAEWLTADGYRLCSGECGPDSHAELVIGAMHEPLFECGGSAATIQGRNRHAARETLAC